MAEIDIITTNMQEESSDHNAYVQRAKEAYDYLESWGTEYFTNDVFWDGILIEKPEVYTKLSPNFAGIILNNYITKTIPKLKIKANFLYEENNQKEEIIKKEQFVNKQLMNIQGWQIELYRFIVDFYVTGRGVLFTPWDQENFTIWALDSKDVMLGINNRKIEFGTHKQKILKCELREIKSLQVISPNMMEGNGSITITYYFDDKDMYILDEDAKTIIMQGQNPYGYIPYLSAAFMPYKSRNYGKSLILKYRQLNREYAWRLSDISTNAKTTCSDEMIIQTDDKKPIENIQRGFGAIHTVEKGGDIKIMQKNQTNIDVNNILDRVKSHIMVDAGLNSSVIGERQDNAKDLSGIALQFFFMGINERIEMARVTLNPIFQELFYRIAKWGKYKISPAIPIYENLIENDRTRMIDDDIKLVEAELMAKETAMEEIGIHEPEQEKIKIRAEKDISNSLQNEPIQKGKIS